MVEDRNEFEEPLLTLGQLLAERGQRFELLAIGGGALQLLGLIRRPTRDLDIVATVVDRRLLPLASLPDALQEAVDDTASLLRMPRTWFNAGPRSLMAFGLPDGVLRRARRRIWGWLTLYLADRADQIFFKLYAAVDQGPRSKHFEDLRSLRPTADELRAALRDLGVDDGER